MKMNFKIYYIANRTIYAHLLENWWQSRYFPKWHREENPGRLHIYRVAENYVGSPRTNRLMVAIRSFDRPFFVTIFFFSFLFLHPRMGDAQTGGDSLCYLCMLEWADMIVWVKWNLRGPNQFNVRSLSPVFFFLFLTSHVFGVVQYRTSYG